MIPIDLTPRWRDVPALAWMAGQAFQVRVPGLATASRLGLWPLFVATFVAARTLGELAAVDRAAVVIVAERTGRGWWRHLVGAGATMTVFCAPAAVMLACGVAGLAVVAAGAPRVGEAVIDLGAAVFAATVVLVFAGLCTQVRWRHLRDLPVGRRIAVGRHPRLVEASYLAADPARRDAAFVLWRGLRHVADERGYAILAYAADETRVRTYCHLGFRPVMSSTGRVLCRAPDRREHQHSQSVRRR